MTVFRCSQCSAEKPIRSGYVDYQVHGVGAKETTNFGRCCLACWGKK